MCDDARLRVPPPAEEGIFVALLTVAFAAVVLVIDPRGSFPLNDDWAYGAVARTLIERGRLEPSWWQSMPLVTHALWGAAFGWLLGFSWFALRISSLVAGWLALVGLYALLREVGWPPRRACAGAAVLMVNPCFVALAHTFMTDVTFLAAVIWTAWVWVRAIGRRDERWLALAAVLGVVATLDRQTGLAIPIAFVVPTVARRAFGRRTPVAALVPMVCAMLALVAYARFRHGSSVSAELYDDKNEALLLGAIQLGHLPAWGRLGGRAVVVLTYLGLYALPFSLAVGRRERARRWSAWPVTAALGAAAGGAVLLAGWSMPLAGNIIADLGIGPRTLAGDAPHAAPAVRWALTVAAGIGAAFLVRAVAGGLADARRGGGLDGCRWKPIAAALAALVLLLPSLIADASMFDRHLLALLPFALAAMSPETSAPTLPAPIAARASGLVAGAVLATFSVGGVHDYLAWQRARWHVVHEMEETMGLPSSAIHAGFEIDNLPADGPGTIPALADRTHAPLVVAASPLDGHTVLRRVPVRAWLPGALRTLYVLARPGGRPDPIARSRR